MWLDLFELVGSFDMIKPFEPVGSLDMIGPF